MIVHLFNSSSVSGPERLVIPALASAREHFVIVNLREERLQALRKSDPLEEYAKRWNVDYCDIRVFGHWDYVAIRDLRVLLDRLDPELVHAHDVKASAYLLHARRALRGRFPIVSTHHGIAGRPSPKTRLYEWLYRRFVLKSFDRIFSVSSADHQRLMESHPNDRLRLHLNGADARLVEPQNRLEISRQLRALWLPEEKDRDSLFLIGIIGRLSKEKDHERALRVLSALNRLPTAREWRCLIFGDGPLEKTLQDKARLLGLENRIVWMGYRKEVAHELAGVDIVMSLSKAEGLPISLIEAGWAGTPVFCTRVGGIQDLVPDESYGETIEPDESEGATALKLQRSLTRDGQTQLRQQAARYQRRITSVFTQSQWMHRLYDLYAEFGIRLGSPRLRDTPWPPDIDGEPPRFSERFHHAVFTRLLMYQMGRLNNVRLWNQEGVRILMYHRFPLNTPHVQEALSRQCAHIASYYKPVSLGDIAHSMETGKALPPNALAVTVDDGYRDFLCHGYPVFRSYGIPLTVFLVSGFLDNQLWLWWDQLRFAIDHSRRPSVHVTLAANRPALAFKLKTAGDRERAAGTLIEALKTVRDEDRRRFIDRLSDTFDVAIPTLPPPAVAPLEWSEVRYLADQGVEFGAHTVTHPILSRLERTDLESEIRLSKRRIEEELSRPVLHFGYPNGLRRDVNEPAFDVLRQADFKTAVSTEKGINFSGAHPYWLRRIGVEPMMSKFNFEVLLAGMGGGRSRQAPFGATSLLETSRL
jgi:glycosyltransferase involved in cell wall biosynthesis/peptidoglycan/xylan/chitin deacetylase (PgdA/CDA1 family)